MLIIPDKIKQYLPDEGYRLDQTSSSLNLKRWSDGQPEMSVFQRLFSPCASNSVCSTGFDIYFSAHAISPGHLLISRKLVLSCNSLAYTFGTGSLSWSHSIMRYSFSAFDLGRAGIADKWCDIALCYRSLTHNYDGSYGGRS